VESRAVELQALAVVAGFRLELLDSAGRCHGATPRRGIAAAVV
jgi:hypothetical protein